MKQSEINKGETYNLNGTPFKVSKIRTRKKSYSIIPDMQSSMSNTYFSEDGRRANASELKKL